MTNIEESIIAYQVKNKQNFFKGVNMRLMNKDEFLKVIKDYELEGIIPDYLPDDLINQVIRDIEEQPEIEAIPIDWLKRKFNPDAHYATLEYKQKAEFVRKLIKEWRDER